MAAGTPSRGSEINTAFVGLGVIFLVLAVFAIRDDQVFFRVLVAAGIMLLTFRFAITSTEPELDNPVLEQLHSQQYGLDRRKYGHLRASTDNLLDHVRQMNRIAVEGREGKLAPRHAQAELDRIAAKMRDLVDDIRKTAGVPTPEGSAVPRAAQAPKPEVVIPRAQQPEDAPQPSSSGHAAPAPPSTAGEDTEALDSARSRRSEP